MYTQLVSRKSGVGPMEGEVGVRDIGGASG